MEGEKPIVTITGITGFLGSRVCHEFLLDGGYQVRGTVRDKKNMTKMQPLIDAFGEEMFKKIDLREADLTNDESMIKAMEGTHYIVHTASPVPSETSTDEKVVGPAVQGTMSALKAAKANKVKRIVITSSIAAVMITEDIDKMTFGPEDWSDINICDPYCKSKTLAEKAAWDFQKELPDEEKFEIVTLQPGLISGTSYINSKNSSSAVYIGIMNGDWKRFPDIGLPTVDVKDCALAHLNAIKIDEAKNQRFILVDKCYKAYDIAMIF